MTNQVNPAISTHLNWHLSKEQISFSEGSLNAPKKVPGAFTWSQIITVAILCLINLMNYMDRSTIPGVLGEIQEDFKIDDAKAGLLQTIFIVIYMIFAPIFGYIGDRYSRRMILGVAICIWSLGTLVGSFMTSFWLFLATRALVAIGEACFTTVAPTIISDMFFGGRRSIMLALFYFAIPVGSGLGYIVASEVSRLAGSWNWGLRVTPFAGAIWAILVSFAIEDPARGESDGQHHEPTPWFDDIKSLYRNRCFVLSTAALAAITFTVGALSWWGAKFISLGQSAQANAVLDDTKWVSTIFGLIGILSGTIGVPLGTYLSRRLRPRFPYADPLVCGVGMLLSVPLLAAGLSVANSNTTTCYVIVFFGQLLLNLNWAVSADMMTYTVISTRRSTAVALQIFISHAFGDAGSPYLIGCVSNYLKKSMSDKTNAESSFFSLQRALFIAIGCELLSAILYFVTAIYIVDYEAKVERESNLKLEVSTTQSDDVFINVDKMTG